MGKITISVCRAYKNSGRFRFHRKKTKPAWKHFFLSDDYTEKYEFGTEWVDAITAQFLKLKKWHLRKFICVECGTIFPAYIKNNRTKTTCPICPEDEEED